MRVVIIEKNKLCCAQRGQGVYAHNGLFMEPDRLGSHGVTRPKNSTKVKHYITVLQIKY